MDKTERCGHYLGNSEALAVTCARLKGHDGEHRSAFEPPGLDEIERELSAIRWYVDNLNNVIARKPVRGLDEAEAGYRWAMDRLSAAHVKVEVVDDA
jgi:hypothetical protein